MSEDGNHWVGQCTVALGMRNKYWASVCSMLGSSQAEKLRRSVFTRHSTLLGELIRVD